MAVSEDLKRFVMDKIGIPDTNVQVISNSVHSGSFVSEEEIVRGRIELGLKDGDHVIGAVGNLYPAKGHQYLLKAMRVVLQQYPSATLVLVGRGDLEASLKEQANQLGIEKKVRFLGLRQDIPNLLAIMSIFVMPSLSEGLFVALLEAMVAGRPVVATRVGGNAELVVNGETGFLVESKDFEALAAAICTLLANRAMREEFGRKAVTRAEERFSARQMADNYRALYNDLHRNV